MHQEANSSGEGVWCKQQVCGSNMANSYLQICWDSSRESVRDLPKTQRYDLPIHMYMQATAMRAAGRIPPFSPFTYSTTPSLELAKCHSGEQLPAVAFAGADQLQQEADALLPLLNEARVHKTAAEVELVRYVNRLGSEAHVAMMQVGAHCALEAVAK